MVAGKEKKEGGTEVGRNIGESSLVKGRDETKVRGFEMRK